MNRVFGLSLVIKRLEKIGQHAFGLSSTSLLKAKSRFKPWIIKMPVWNWRDDSIGSKALPVGGDEKPKSGWSIFANSPMSFWISFVSSAEAWAEAATWIFGSVSGDSFSALSFAEVVFASAFFCSCAWILPLPASIPRTTPTRIVVLARIVLFLRTAGNGLRYTIIVPCKVLFRHDSVVNPTLLERRYEFPMQ